MFDDEPAAAWDSTNTPASSADDQNKLDFLSSFQIYPPPKATTVSIDKVLSLYDLTEKYQLSCEVAQMRGTTLSPVAKHHKQVHVETIGMLVSMTVMVVVRFLRGPFSITSPALFTNTTNITIINATSCIEQILPPCQSFQDSTPITTLASLALLSHLSFALLLCWRNFSYTILCRVLKNAHVFFIIFLMCIVALLEIRFSLSSQFHQIIFTMSYIVAISTFLLLDVFKTLPSYATLLISLLIVIIETERVCEFNLCFQRLP